MANFCLMPDVVQKFRQGLKSGDIDPEKLSNMSSEERNKFFEDYVGKGNSKDVNALFESKLLLKNQKQGMITWAKSVAGISEKARTDMVSKITRMDKVLDPDDKQAFLKDLASTKLGVNVTQDEAKTIAGLAKSVSDTAENREKDGTFNTQNQRMAYGRAHFDLADYVQNLKDNANKFQGSDLYKHPVNSVGKLANLSRSFKTIGDLSIAFRNGFKLMATHPKDWANAFSKGTGAMVKTLGGKDAWREVQAYVRSSPYYDDMVKSNLLPKSEEAYPISIPEKIPVLGRVAHATQVGYEATAQLMRVDSYATVIKGAERAGVDITDPKFKKDLGKFIGALTNRGSIGKLEGAGNIINTFLFSPRALASTIHLATDWARLDYDPYIRKQAGIALIKTGTLIAGTMAIANALAPGSIELDPRSSNFGKIKVGNVTFDISGGMSTLANLGARLYTGTTKSATSGKVSSLTSGAFGSQTRLNEVINFFLNKSAPAVSTIVNQLRGTDAVGNKITLGSQATNAATPLGIETLQNALKDTNKNDPNAVVTMLLDDMGITASVNSTGGSAGEPTWDTKSTKTLTQFKQKVGNATFQKAAQQYDSQYNSWVSKIKSNARYNSMSPDQQQTLITKAKADIQKNVFKANGNFKYKKSPSTASQYKSLLP